MYVLLGGGIPEDDGIVPDDWEAADSDEEVSNQLIMVYILVAPNPAYVHR